MPKSPARANQLVWFRNDLRTRDHEALSAALDAGPTVALFLWAERQWRRHDVGDNRLAFLRRCLAALHQDLLRLRVPLLVLEAPTFARTPKILAQLCTALTIDTVHASEEYPLNERVRDSRTRHALSAVSTRFQLYAGNAIISPGLVLKDDGDPYTVFTPFKRRWATHLTAALQTPLPAPAAQPAAIARQLHKQLQAVVNDDSLTDLTPCTEACLNLAQPFAEVDGERLADLWPGGAKDAEQRLERFAANAICAYDSARDMAASNGTSALSPYLSIGALSGRSALAAAQEANQQQLLGGNPGVATWVSELIWRDFYRHVIVHFPGVSKHQAFRPDTEFVPWRDAPAELAAWQAGETGYPMVDAGMRQLNATGWMHNRLRMVCAMFLSKHLLIDWRVGERYFMEQLVDGDFAANNGGWQWSASTGTDSVPYFRIFNPTTQAERFDPDGEFICRWVPELKPLQALLGGRRKKLFYQPWEAGTAAGGYPQPIVDHKAARERVLTAFKAIRPE